MNARAVLRMQFSYKGSNIFVFIVFTGGDETSCLVGNVFTTCSLDYCQATEIYKHLGFYKLKE